MYWVNFLAGMSSIRIASVWGIVESRFRSACTSAYNDCHSKRSFKVSLEGKLEKNLSSAWDKGSFKLQTTNYECLRIYKLRMFTNLRIETLIWNWTLYWRLQITNYECLRIYELQMFTNIRITNVYELRHYFGMELYTESYGLRMFANYKFLRITN